MIFKTISLDGAIYSVNTDLRAEATPKCFEENHFKLMNNAVFWKTMEDVEKRKNVVLVRPSEGDRIRRLIANPAFISRKVFSKNLATIHSVKTKIILIRPMYVGMCVLDLSKLHM